MKVVRIPLRRALRAYRRGRDGAAAVETALMLPILLVPLLNAIDLGSYAFQRMQVENAAVIGSEEARSFCNSPTKLPATTTCTGFSSAETSAIQSTSLGTNVSAVSGYPKEGYYCTLTDGTIQLVASVPTAPLASCSSYTAPSGKAWSAPSAIPSDFIQIRVNYTYTPSFGSVSLASLLPGTITATTWSRLQ